MGDFPPLYTASSLPVPPTLPQYTQDAGEHERVLTRSSEPSSPVTFAVSRARHCVYKTDHLEIDLGMFPCTLMHPAYGFNGVVEGVIRFVKGCSYITQVSVKVRVGSSDVQPCNVLLTVWTARR